VRKAMLPTPLKISRVIPLSKSGTVATTHKFVLKCQEWISPYRHTFKHMASKIRKQIS